MTFAAATLSPRQHRPARRRIVVLCLVWIIAIIPFVFFRRDTWFGRPLSDQQIGEYLHANEKPRQIEYALGQIGQRMARHDNSVSIWYADLVRLSSHPLEEVRATDALVMGENAGLPMLHSALEDQLYDPSSSVRFNAAVSLARAGDKAGHDVIDSLLSQPNVRSEQVAQALNALQQIGDVGDLPLLSGYETSPQLPDRVRQQAAATANAIKARTLSSPAK